MCNVRTSTLPVQRLRNGIALALCLAALLLIGGGWLERRNTVDAQYRHASLAAN